MPVEVANQDLLLAEAVNQLRIMAGRLLCDAASIGRACVPHHCGHVGISPTPAHVFPQSRPGVSSWAFPVVVAKMSLEDDFVFAGLKASSRAGLDVACLTGARPASPSHETCFLARVQAGFALSLQPVPSLIALESSGCFWGGEFNHPAIATHPGGGANPAAAGGRAAGEIPAAAGGAEGQGGPVGKLAPASLGGWGVGLGFSEGSPRLSFPLVPL